MSDYKMKCPYCENIFTLTEQQFNWNTKFKCSQCKRFNDGSQSADKNGVLIGIKMTNKEG